MSKTYMHISTKMPEYVCVSFQSLWRKSEKMVFVPPNIKKSE